MKEFLLYLNPDVCLRVIGGVWYASNPRLRTHVVVDPLALDALGLYSGGQNEEEWQQALLSGCGYDCTQRELGWDGLHADHSGKAMETGACVSGVELFHLLRKRRVLIANDDEAFDLVRPLSSPLDMESVGSFHQRVGQHLLLSRQREPWRAWQNQKFTEDGLALRSGTYLRIQGEFFQQYFTQKRLSGKRVLDFGCGNGFFSARMARCGASVLAMDNSAELLDMARRNHGSITGLELVETHDFDAVLNRCASEPAGSFDYITLQDTLLLLLQPERGLPSSQLLEVFRAFHRLLKPNGKLCAMEPNASFWLASRYGHPEKPYAVVSEYFTQGFHVAPILETVIGFMAEAGFALAGFQHPRPATDVEKDADLAYQREFPIWDFFEFVPRPQEM